MWTVSKEMAAKLKEAGLQWEPSWSDQFTDDSGLVFNLPDDYVIHHKEEFIWLPTLPDLLEWLEGRGYIVNIVHEYVVQEYVFNNAKPHYCCNIWEKGIDRLEEYWRETDEFKADTREDAVAQAVLWVLEQEAKKV